MCVHVDVTSFLGLGDFLLWRLPWRFLVFKTSFSCFLDTKGGRGENALGWWILRMIDVCVDVCMLLGHVCGCLWDAGGCGASLHMCRR